jgi:hypothetical protein
VNQSQTIRKDGIPWVIALRKAGKSYTNNSAAIKRHKQTHNKRQKDQGSQSARWLNKAAQCVVSAVEVNKLVAL